jgi:uncharacterized protein (TIGR04255 family)
VGFDMKLPKKITPDRIRDSIVEVRYNGKVPHEVAIGMFFKSLDDTYTYANRPFGKSSKENIPSELNFPFGNPLPIFPNLFHNSKIKIQLLPGSIVFNCLNEYILWDNYKNEIQHALNQMLNAGVVDKFTRVGLRYITEYPNEDLNNCVKFTFTFGMPQLKSDAYSFQAEYRLDEHRIVLRLKNNLAKKNQVSPISTIDIDVIKENLNIVNSQQLFVELDDLHLKEKEVFFSLLKEDFLENLKPEY